VTRFIRRVADLATRLRDFATNRHEYSGPGSAGPVASEASAQVRSFRKGL
jgi:hypothetical protein